jgi:hypothetical protein
VGTGGGGVQRRGTGQSGRTGGPVGDSSGYSDRQRSAPVHRKSTSSRTPGTTPFGAGGLPSGLSGLASGGGCVKYIVIAGIVLVILYVLASMLGGGPEEGLDSGGITSTGFVPASATAATTYIDEGAYPVSTAVSPLAREKRTVLKGDGTDSATVMVYLCGTDLEAQGGMATADLNEMLHAEISEQVNIIIETGGAYRWQNSVISNKTNQRYRATPEGLELLEGDVGKRSMVDPATLADFIRYCAANYPADRYMLVMWDHGAGTLKGFGYDQYFPGDSMTLDEIAAALAEGGVAFDVIGFDACLMATLETAVVLEPHADYMIASEEVEPGIGWHYTGWITTLSENTSLPTTELGKRLIDDYVAEVKKQTPRSQATLSLIDLAELKGTVPSTLAAFSASTTELIDSDDYRTVSDARAGTKEFSPSARLDQIDLVHFAENVGTREAKTLADALRGCIKYNRTSANITNANGVSVFFPYGGLSQVSSILDTYEDIGLGEEYREFVRSFASVSAGGQVAASGSNNMLGVLLSGMSGGTSAPPTPGSPGADAIQALLEAFLSSGDFGSLSSLAGDPAGWLDTDRMQAATTYYVNNQFDPSALRITEKDGQWVLALSQAQWDLVQFMEMNVFVDDGEGFIDLGLDNVYEYNDEGALVMEYDGTWLALNGNIVSYYLETDDHYGDTYTIRGRVPAILNDQMVDIIVVFNDENPYGEVLGAQKRYDPETQTETVAKGLIDIVSGDRIDFLCDYYTYEGEYRDTYFLGDQYVATGTWEIENLPVGDLPYQMTYRITDIYGNRFWTPSVSD